MSTRSAKQRVKDKRAAHQAALDALPVVGAEQCGDCWAIPGAQHELSCPSVTVEQFNAVVFAGQE